jgi:hypothetical protein
MSTPLMNDQFEGILQFIDRLIRHRGLESLLLEVESLFGFVTIYETMIFTSSSGVIGLLAKDYPPPPQNQSISMESVADDLPLLSLLEKIGGFALLSVELRSCSEAHSVAHENP